MITLLKRKSFKANVVVGILATLGVIVFLGGCTGCYYVTTSNKEVGLRNLITAKQRDNVQELDLLQKKIGQSAAVSSEQMKTFKDIVTGYAEARSGGKTTGSLINVVREVVPQVDQQTFLNLQNIITGSRDRFSQRQKEILDLKREHDDLRTKFPSSIICSSRPEIQVQIVTSSRSKENFETGEDNDTSVFAKPEKPATK